MSILRQSIGVFVTRIWGAAVGLVVSIIIARTLGPEGKGIYSLLLLVPTLLVTLGNGGLQIANIYFAGKKRAKISELASNSLWSAFIFGLLIIGLFALAYPFLREAFFRDVPTGYLFTVVCTIPFMLANSYFANLLLALKKVKLYNLANAIQLTLVLVTVSVLLLVTHLGLVATVIAIVSNMIVGAALMVGFVRANEKFTLRFYWQLFGQTMKYGAKGYFANLIQFLNYRVDMLLLSYFVGTAAVGQYSVAVNFAEVLWFLPTSIGTILFPHVARSTNAVANIVTAKISRQTILLMAMASAAVAIVTPRLIPLIFGVEFTPAVAALLYLLPGVLVFSIAKILGNDFSGRGWVVTNGVVSGIALAINVGLNIFLIPRYGINGAAVASTISYTAATIVLVWLFARYTRVPVLDLIIPHKGDLSSVLQIFRRTQNKAT